MPYPYLPYGTQLETALVISLRDSLRWESSVAPVNASGTYSGTLTPPNTAVLNALDYQRRDRELAWLDTRNAAAVVEVSLECADVWNASVLRPTMEGPQVGHIDYQPQDLSANGLMSKVVHVRHASVPMEAIEVDRDLAGRDIVIYETLFNAVRNLFNPTPITTSGAPDPALTAWSFATGTAAQADINLNLPLDRDLFKTPDMNLADRDNQMAGYTAQLCQILKNPFAYADRLYVAVYGVDSREVETYTFIEQPFQSGQRYLEGDEIYYQGTVYRVKAGVGSTFDVPWTSPATWEVITAPTLRVWTAEPALSGRNRFIYDTDKQTLQWFRENNEVQHVEQLVGMSVPGIFSGQTLSVVAKVPERKDGQFWRTKALHVVPSGGTLTDIYSLPNVASQGQKGFAIQTNGASLTIPASGSFYFPRTVNPVWPQTVPPGQYRVACLVEPNSVVEIAGGANHQGVGGIEGGVTFSGFQTVTYSVGLPPTQWTMEIDYTNISGTTSGYRIVATLDGEAVFDATAPLYFTDEDGNAFANGTIVTTPAFPIAPTGSAQVLALSWTEGTGQLHIRAIRFRSSAYPTGRYRMTGTFAGQTGTVDVIGEDRVPGVLNWDFTASTTTPNDFRVSWERNSELPVRFLRADLAQLGTNTPTPGVQGFENYKHDCLVRAVRSARQAFTEAYYSGTEAGTFLSYGTAWDADASERWMAMVECGEPRLRQLDSVPADGVVPSRQYYVVSGSLIYEGYGYGTGKEPTFVGNRDSVYVWAVPGQVNQVGAWIQAKATHNGRPMLAPAGLYFDYATGTATSNYVPAANVPELVTCQPWMIKLGLYAAQPEFWLPTNV